MRLFPTVGLSKDRCEDDKHLMRDTRAAAEGGSWGLHAAGPARPLDRCDSDAAVLRPAALVGVPSPS